jgi:hypothetical protein
MGQRRMDVPAAAFPLACEDLRYGLPTGDFWSVLHKVFTGVSALQNNDLHIFLAF